MSNALDGRKTLMQILGTSGKAGSGKTTLCRHAAKEIINGTYGSPVLLSYSKFGGVEGVGKLLKEHLCREFARLDEGGTETLLLIDDVQFPEQVEQIHNWGGLVIFVCADGRFLDREDIDTEKEKMANEYTVGKSTDVFDLCITNHQTEDAFKSEISNFMHLFLGGDASYEAGLF